MALFKFTDAILNGRPIDVYGHGRIRRDFTYVEDLVEAVVKLGDCSPRIGEVVSQSDSLSPIAPFRTVNITGGQPTELMDFIRAIESALDQKASLNMLDMQPGDVVATASDTALLEALIGSVPQTDAPTGVASFVEWYRAHSQVRA